MKRIKIDKKNKILKSKTEIKESFGEIILN
jgi:hypothetical protein